MRCLAVVLLLAGSAWGQAMTEAAAAAAGGSVGGVAGKKVSDGITNIFNKVDKQTASAAATGDPVQRKKQASSPPLLDVGPGVPSGEGKGGSVPPPPPPARRVAAAPKPASRPLARPVLEAAPAPPPPPPPPAPEVTTADLKTVSLGMNREDVLKLGQPASRLTMYEDGHLTEIYRYMHGDNTLGAVWLSDGAVANIQVR